MATVGVVIDVLSTHVETGVLLESVVSVELGLTKVIRIAHMGNRNACPLVSGLTYLEDRVECLKIKMLQLLRLSVVLEAVVLW